MSTPRYLSLIADASETAAGITTAANSSPAGFWKRIALAMEEIAGAVTSANDTATGWMKRATAAVVARTGFAGTGYNPKEEGYLAWMVAALEAELSTITTGSLEKRLYDLILVAGFGDTILREDGFHILRETGDKFLREV